jgi:hypothetical protein
VYQSELQTVAYAVEVIKRYEVILGDTHDKKKPTAKMVNATIQEGFQLTSTVQILAIAALYRH